MKKTLIKIVNKANNNVQQHYKGIRPFRCPTLSKRSSKCNFDKVWTLLKNQDLWKCLFGFTVGNSNLIKGRLYPVWQYHWKRSGILKRNTTVSKILDYLNKIT